MDFSGKNQAIFKEVLSHYSKKPADSLKYKAAVYLISNMTGHYSYAGYKKDAIDTIIGAIAIKRKNMNGMIWNFNSQAFVDSIWDRQMELAKKRSVPPHFVFDSRVITKDYLIKNIDEAFNAWNLPWSRNISFKNFCEYILPYRIYDEPLELWRQNYAHEFSWVKKVMLDSNSSDPVLAARLIADSLFKSFNYLYKFQQYPSSLGPLNLLKAKMGDCLDEANIRIFAMRAMGIPVALEQVPRWADRSLGHAFISVMNKNGQFVDVTGAQLGTELKKFPYIPPKVYRTQFFCKDFSNLIDEVSTGAINANMERFQIDVTNSHINTKDLHVDISSSGIKVGEKIYLCVFDDFSWSPFTSTNVDNAYQVNFKDIGLGAIYLPVVMREQMIPVGNPILLGRDGYQRHLTPNLKLTETFQFTPKYYQTEKQRKYLPMLRNGIIEGANRSDFSDSKVLFQIWKPTIGLNLSAVIPGKYRYVRYKFPDYGDGSISDLRFFADTTIYKPLDGQIITSSKLKGKNMRVLFDNHLDNYFAVQKNGQLKGEWVGLDFGKARVVSFIEYAPRHDMESIKASSYELFYWKDSWISLGQGKLLPSISQEFKNVPQGALLMLRSIRNTDRRIFVVKNKKIEWW